MYAVHQSRKRGRAEESDEEFDFFEDYPMAADESKEGDKEEAPLTVSTAKGMVRSPVDVGFLCSTARY